MHRKRVNDLGLVAWVVHSCPFSAGVDCSVLLLFYYFFKLSCACIFVNDF